MMEMCDAYCICYDAAEESEEGGYLWSSHCSCVEAQGVKNLRKGGVNESTWVMEKVTASYPL